MKFGYKMSRPNISGITEVNEKSKEQNQQQWHNMTRRERENLTEKCTNRHHAAKEQKSRQ